MNHFHFHFRWTYLGLLKDLAVQVHLEIRVDGGGGEAGEEVIQLSHQWNWTHGVKVVIMIFVILIVEDERETGEDLWIAYMIVVKFTF